MRVFGDQRFLLLVLLDDLQVIGLVVTVLVFAYAAR
jgi:hypothetical protein